MFDFSELYENLGKFPDQLEKALMQYAKTAAAKLHGQAVRDLSLIHIFQPLHAVWRAGVLLWAFQDQ